MRAEPLGPLFLELYNKDSKKVATGKEVAAGIRIRHPTTHPAKNPRSAMARAKAPTRLRREWSAPWCPTVENAYAQKSQNGQRPGSSGFAPAR